MKIKHWLVSVPALMTAAMPAAHAGTGENWLCLIAPWLCHQTGPGNGGGGPVSVPEPELLALFTVGLVFVAAMAVRRIRSRN